MIIKVRKYDLIMMLTISFIFLNGLFQRLNYLFFLLLVITTFFVLMNHKTRKQISKPIYFMFFIYYCYIVLSIVIFKNPRIDMGTKQYIIFSLVFFNACLLIQNLQVIRLLRFASLLGTLNACLGIYEYFVNSYILNGINERWLNNWVRASGLSGNFISFPMVCGFCVLFELYLWNVTRKRIYIVSIFICFCGVLVSASRGPLIALLIAIIFMIMVRDNSILSQKKLQKRIFIYGILLLILFQILLLLSSDITLGNNLLDSIINRIRSIIVWDGSNGDTSNVTRLTVWKYMFTDYFLPNKWFGLGVGATGSVGEYISTIGVTESSILKRLVEIGIVGTIINFALYGILIYRGVKLYKTTDNNLQRMLLCLFFSVIILIFVEGTVLQIIENQVAMCMLWFSLAFVNIYPKMLQE
jgi:hypothetical protein